MRILLDESVPRGLKKLLPDHEVRTVAEQGWRSSKNSALLELAQVAFDVFITADQGFEHEQNLEQIQIGVVILVARSNRLVDYEPLAPRLIAAVEEVRAGDARKVAAADPG